MPPSAPGTRPGQCRAHRAHEAGRADCELRPAWLVDEAALVDALQSSHVAGVALDVFGDEPLLADSPLCSLPSVVLIPHLTASTVEAQRDVGTQIVEQVLAALRVEEHRNAVNMPVADAAVIRDLRPFLILAEKLGSLQMQLAEGRIKRVEVEFQADTVGENARPLTVALLKGLLDPICDTPVNYISAPHRAMQRGIALSETRRLLTSRYANLVPCRVFWDDGERLVAGSLLGRELLRVLQIDTFRMDAQPQGIVLMMETLDVPGVVGRGGGVLGRTESISPSGDWAALLPGRRPYRSSTSIHQRHPRCWMSCCSWKG